MDQQIKKTYGPDQVNPDIDNRMTLGFLNTWIQQNPSDGRIQNIIQSSMDPAQKLVSLSKLWVYSILGTGQKGRSAAQQFALGLIRTLRLQQYRTDLDTNQGFKVNFPNTKNGTKLYDDIQQQLTESVNQLRTREFQQLDKNIMGGNARENLSKQQTAFQTLVKQGKKDTYQTQFGLQGQGAKFFGTQGQTTFKTTQSRNADPLTYRDANTGLITYDQKKLFPKQWTPPQTNFRTYKNAMAKFSTTALKDNGLQYSNLIRLVPSFQLKARQVLKKRKQLLNTAQAMNKQLKTKESKTFKKLSQIDKRIYWDQNNLSWVAKSGYVGKWINRFGTPAQYNRKYQQAQLLAEIKLSQKQVNQWIPPLVANIIKANDMFSTRGIGPISNNSLPFYVGRWIDPTTGRVRVLPPASKKLISPVDLRQNLGYLQAQILNKWNSFVQVQQKYIRMSQLNQSQFTQKVKKNIIATLDNKDQIQQTIQWYFDLIQKWKLGLQLSQNYRMALQNTKDGPVAGATQMGDAMLTILKSGGTYGEQLQKIVKLVQKYIQNNQKIDNNWTQAKKKKMAGMWNAQAAIKNKSTARTASALKKIYKIQKLKGGNISQQQVQKMKQGQDAIGQSLQDFINKRFTKNKKQQLIKNLKKPGLQNDKFDQQMLRQLQKTILNSRDARKNRVMADYTVATGRRF